MLWAASRMDHSGTRFCCLRNCGKWIYVLIHMLFWLFRRKPMTTVTLEGARETACETFERVSWINCRYYFQSICAFIWNSHSSRLLRLRMYTFRFNLPKWTDEFTYFIKNYNINTTYTTEQTKKKSASDRARGGSRRARRSASFWLKECEMKNGKGYYLYIFIESLKKNQIPGTVKCVDRFSLGGDLNARSLETLNTEYHTMHSVGCAWKISSTWVRKLVSAVKESFHSAKKNLNGHINLN